MAATPNPGTPPQHDDTGDHAGAGRPVNSAATPALLRAARELVTAHGYEHVTMQMIADRAGVSRQSAYRRWPTKAELVLDALIARATELTEVHEGTVAHQLAQFLKGIFNGIEGDRNAITGLIAAAQTDPQFNAVFQTRFVEPRDTLMANILAQGASPAATANARLAAEVVHGAYWYRLLLGKPLTAAYARELATMGMRMLGED